MISASRLWQHHAKFVSNTGQTESSNGLPLKQLLKNSHGIAMLMCEYSSVLVSTSILLALAWVLRQ